MNAKTPSMFEPFDQGFSDCEEIESPSLKVESLKNKNFHFIIDSLQDLTEEKVSMSQNFASIIKITPFQYEPRKESKRVRKKHSTIGPIISEVSTSSSLKKSEMTRDLVSTKRVSFSGYQNMPKSNSKGILKLEMSRYSQEFTEEEEGRKRSGSVDILKYRQAQSESQDANYLAELEAQWETGNIFYLLKKEYNHYKSTKQKNYSASYPRPTNKQENTKSHFAKTKRPHNFKKPLQT